MAVFYLISVLSLVAANLLQLRLSMNMLHELVLMDDYLEQFIFDQVREASKSKKNPDQYVAERLAEIRKLRKRNIS